MRRLLSSLQFRLTAGFAIFLALAIAGVSAFSAITTRQQTEEFAAEVEAVRTERAERLVENAYQASHNWSEVQLVVAQVGGLLGWRMVITDTDGYVVADSHELVVTPMAETEHFARSWRKAGPMHRTPIVVGGKVVAEMLINTSSSYHRPALSVSDFGADLFEAYGFPVRDNSSGSLQETSLFPRSSLDGRIPAERIAGTQQAAVTQDVLDELLVEPPLSDLEASFRRSMIIAGIATTAAGLVFVTFFTRQALSPVRGLTSAARKLGSGDLSYRVPVPETRQDEIGELARTFNEMATDLESAEWQRRRMTADIAHELRTPLTNIQGYLEAILDGVVQPDAETITNLHAQTVHLSHLVDDLRVLAIAEAGALRLETAPDSIESVLRETVASFEPRAAEHEIALNVAIEEELPLVELDRTRMRQVFVNLIENAIHHTPPGGEVSLEVTTNARHEVVMTVSDTGRGIPEEELPRIFDQFYRVDPSRARSTGGAGLGLTIVKRFVEAHGGHITVESAPGDGTVFRITLPAATAFAPGGED